MPIQVERYAQFKGFAVDPSEVSLTEAETKELPVVSQEGQLLKSKFIRYGLNFTIRGVRLADAQPFITQANLAGIQLFTGSPQREDISFMGRIIYQAVLVKAEITQPIQLNGSDLVEQLTLNYESQIFV